MTQSSVKLSRDEGIMIFTALENLTIKGKDSVKLAPLLVKLDKHITKLIEKEGPPSGVPTPTDAMQKMAANK